MSTETLTFDVLDIDGFEALAEIDTEEFMNAEGELHALAPPYHCPPPTRWRQTGATMRSRGGWSVVSSAVVAKRGPIRHTFQVQRSITWTATARGSAKGMLRLIEIELGIDLTRSEVLSKSETLSYTVPKGRTMALFAAAGYLVRTFERTVYGGAMCNPVNQQCTVSTPHAHLLKADYI